MSKRPELENYFYLLEKHKNNVRHLNAIKNMQGNIDHSAPQINRRLLLKHARQDKLNMETKRQDIQNLHFIRNMRKKKELISRQFWVDPDEDGKLLNLLLSLKEPVPPDVPKFVKPTTGKARQIKNTVTISKKKSDRLDKSDNKDFCIRKKGHKIPTSQISVHFDDSLKEFTKRIEERNGSGFEMTRSGGISNTMKGTYPIDSHFRDVNNAQPMSSTLDDKSNTTKYYKEEQYYKVKEPNLPSVTETIAVKSPRSTKKQTTKIERLSNNHFKRLESIGFPTKNGIIRSPCYQDEKFSKLYNQFNNELFGDMLKLKLNETVDNVLTEFNTNRTIQSFQSTAFYNSGGSLGETVGDSKAIRRYVFQDDDHIVQIQHNNYDQLDHTQQHFGGEFKTPHDSPRGSDRQDGMYSEIGPHSPAYGNQNKYYDHDYYPIYKNVSGIHPEDYENFPPYNVEGVDLYGIRGSGGADQYVREPNRNQNARYNKYDENYPVQSFYAYSNSSYPGRNDYYQGSQYSNQVYRERKRKSSGIMNASTKSNRKSRRKTTRRKDGSDSPCFYLDSVYDKLYYTRQSHPNMHGPYDSYYLDHYDEENLDNRPKFSFKNQCPQVIDSLQTASGTDDNSGIKKSSSHPSPSVSIHQPPSCTHQREPRVRFSHNINIMDEKVQISDPGLKHISEIEIQKDSASILRDSQQLNCSVSSSPLVVNQEQNQNITKQIYPANQETSNSQPQQNVTIMQRQVDDPVLQTVDSESS